jgi:hypothetical protein
MSTGAKAAFGSKFLIGSGAIEELYDIQPNDSVAKLVAVTSHDSAADANGVPIDEHLPTTVDEGEITLAGNYKAATNQEVLRNAKGGAARAMTFNLPGGSGNPKLTFSGIVSSFKLNTPLADRTTFTAKVKITGPVTWGTQS